jgi:hypothetical protein
MNNCTIEKQTWEKFINSGMMWFANRILHVFGWTIAYETDEQDNILNVFPARCS